MKPSGFWGEVAKISRKETEDRPLKPLALKIQEHLTSVGIKDVDVDRTDITILLEQVLQLDGTRLNLIKENKDPSEAHR